MASRKGPPTENQLNRIDELLDHPAMDGYMESLAGKWDQLIATMGGAGVLIGWMKSIIAKNETENQEFVEAAKAAINRPRLPWDIDTRPVDPDGPVGGL